MRALIQRVNEASVTIDGKVFSSIGRGLLVYLGVHREDGERDLDWVAKKILGARIFENDQGKMSESVRDTQGELLVISQITLYGDMTRGNRPDMGMNMKPPAAEDLYERLLSKLKDLSGLKVEKGGFGASMHIRSVNDGPVTVWLDSGNLK